ncbi:MAG: TetR family transcriptional regulator [Clostridiales bacterium]|nr:TetR family transcriptional regulator [Clostridiales bacterium]
MPRKPVTTREDVVEGAFQLIRSEGMEALTARNLARRLGCSTQPVMYHFPELSALWEAAYLHADRYHTEYLFAGRDLMQIGLRYIRFAAEEPNLFRFLFQSGRFAGISLRDMIDAPEAAELMRVVAAQTGLAPGEAAAFFEPLYAAVHGYASLIANNAMRFDTASIEMSLRSIALGLLREGGHHDEAVQEE